MSELPGVLENLENSEHMPRVAGKVNYVSV